MYSSNTMDNLSELYSENIIDLMECTRCSRIWDGNAQCLCCFDISSDSDDEDSTEDIYTEWMQTFPANSESVWVNDSRHSWLIHEYDSIGYQRDQISIIDALVFEDEYVLEESATDSISLDSTNNSQNKKYLHEIIDILDTYKETFTGGDHLHLMNLVQRVYSNQ